MNQLEKYGISYFIDKLTGLYCIMNDGLPRSKKYLVNEKREFERVLDNNLFEIKIQNLDKPFSSYFNSDNSYLISHADRTEYSGPIDFDLEHICLDLYNNSLQYEDKPWKIFGSFTHRGYVNQLGGNHSPRYEFYSYTQTIGSTYDPEKIKLIHDQYSDYGVFKNGLFDKYVRLLCQYCEDMFGISKYDVIKEFETKDTLPLYREIEKEKLKYRDDFNFMDVNMFVLHLIALHRELAQIYIFHNDYKQALEILHEAFDIYLKYKERMKNLHTDMYELINNSIKVLKDYYREHENISFCVLVH